MGKFKLDVLLWIQTASWKEVEEASRRIDRLGFSTLWFWDHMYAINTHSPLLPIFEGWSSLAGLAGMTEQVRLGLLVGANTFRNPGLLAKTASTVDHISGGRVTLGVGAAWFELEHRALGQDFGSGFGQRLDWLDESVGAMRRLLDGEAVTSEPGGHYRFDDLRVNPRPVQAHLPIMIGGGGEKKTLRTVAKYADMWNHSGDIDYLVRKDGILRAHCEAVGRDPSTIERSYNAKMLIRDTPEEARRVWAAQMLQNDCPEEDWDDPSELWLGPPAFIAEEIRRRQAIGFDTLVAMLAAPYDMETIDRLAGEVRPLVEAAG
jgi:alkanesulfonate monooxygenase SsuD/methylene tetrahydromethanopterin reductase-like flavin-dependent oxidoreductase (luciferase family)